MSGFRLSTHRASRGDVVARAVEAPTTSRSPSATGSVATRMTLTEKILGRKTSEGAVSAGDNVWVNVDKLLTHDVCGPGTFGVFEREFGQNAKVRCHAAKLLLVVKLRSRLLCQPCRCTAAPALTCQHCSLLDAGAGGWRKSGVLACASLRLCVIKQRPECATHRAMYPALLHGWTCFRLAACTLRRLCASQSHAPSH